LRRRRVEVAINRFDLILSSCTKDNEKMATTPSGVSAQVLEDH
jgi:hypothetical protein